MKGGLLLAAGLFASVAAAVPAAEMDFGTPATVHGQANVSGLEWALLVFHSPGPTAIDFDLEGPIQLTNHTRAEVHTEELPQVAAQKLPVFLPAQSAQLSSVEGVARFAEGWSSLVIYAEDLQLHLAQVNATLARVENGTAIDDHLPGKELPQWTFRIAEHRVADDAAVVSSYQQEGTPFQLRANGVRRLEWHNTTVLCSTSDCPEGGGFVAAGPNPTAAIGSAWQRSFIELEPRDGTLVGNGTAYMLAAGGRVVDAEL